MGVIIMSSLTKVASLSLLCAVFCVESEAKSILDKMYVKAGAGAMYFEKFKATETKIASGYKKKAPKRICPILNIGVGYRINNSVRADINLQYTKINYKATDIKQSIRTTSTFVNGYYDFKFHDKIVPYLTAGIGIGINKAGELQETYFQQRKGKNKTNLIWNIGAGAQYIINECFAIDLWYRYMDLGLIKTDDESALALGGKQKLRGHQVIGSLIYNF